MTIKVIIFDYGNVLDVPEDMPYWLQNRELAAQQIGLDGQQLWELLYHSDPWQRVKRGQISQEAFWNEILAPRGILDGAKQRLLVETAFRGREKVHHEMATLLRALKPHYRLAMLSNTDIVDMAHWLAQDRGLEGIFDLVVSSAQVGMAKPDPEIYTYTLQKLGVAGNETIFVDDLVRNTSVAATLGIDCIVFESPAQVRRELRLRGITLDALSLDS